MTVSLKLKKPIRHGDDEILILEFREPTAKDIKNLGYPVTVKEEVDAGVIFNYTVALTNLPPSVIFQISASLNIESSTFYRKTKRPQSTD